MWFESLMSSNKSDEISMNFVLDKASSFLRFKYAFRISSEKKPGFRELIIYMKVISTQNLGW